MDDAISRQAVLKLLSTMPPEEAITKAMLIQNVKYMSAAQPEKRTEERTEKHACDCISRQAAIDALDEIRHALWEIDIPSPTVPEYIEHHEQIQSVWKLLDKKQKELYVLPSAQPKCAKDFVMLKVIDLNGRPYYSIIYFENGNEFEGYSSYDLKVISEYLKRYFGFAQPERQNGEWIDYTEDGYVECPFCHNATNCDGNKDELHFCFSCGADMREVSE